MLTLIARWFEPVNPSQDYQRSDYVVLWLILAVGAVLRFWGLGNVGLHGDEETMAMPAMAILETGHPILPSGMYYARALINIFLMSGSAWLFGESEWAFRLPSAIVGSLTGIAAFYMGRRFLSPQFNIAFVATIALLPGMIEISQTARMYIFLVTCLIWFAACVFRWERDQRISSLILAILVWFLCLHFQRLAIFAAPLFLFPGLSRQSWAQLIQGAAAFLIGFLIFNRYGVWISTKYPDSSERPTPLDVDVPQTALDVLSGINGSLLAMSFVVIAALVVVLFFKLARRSGWSRAMPVLLVGAGLLAMAALQYHVGGIMLMLGVVFWLRTPELPRAWLLTPIVLAAALTLIHLGILHESGLYPGRKIIGALIGTPSIWPVLRFLQYSPVAGALYAAVFLFALSVFVRGRRLPMHFLFFIMSVWAPLLILGVFAWNVPPRYAQGQLGVFLLCSFAAIEYVGHQRQWIPTSGRMPRSTIVVLAIICVAIINPVVLGRTVNPGYDLYPDHKGAAEYIQSLDLAEDAVLIAEDVLQQTYYLGEVDYWLRQIENSHGYSIIRDGRLVDQYTGSVTLGTGAELEAVLDHSQGVDVYVIGSGENFVQGKRLFREHGIKDVLESNRLRTVYSGRDGKTKIWKLVH